MNANDRTGAAERPPAGVTRQADGRYRESLGEGWVAEYAEDPGRGLWRADLFHHDVATWVSVEHETLADAVRATRDHYAQL